MTTVTSHRAGLAGATVLSLIAAALSMSAGAASAAPPVVCVRNASGAPIEVVAGVQNTPERSGVYLGEATPKGGACRFADIDGDMNVSIRRGVSANLSLYSSIPTAGGGWKACPAQLSETGQYVYTVRRGWFGMTCTSGGDTAGLEDAGDYE